MAELICHNDKQAPTQKELNHHALCPKKYYPDS